MNKKRIKGFFIILVLSVVLFSSGCENYPGIPGISGNKETKAGTHSPVPLPEAPNAVPLPSLESYNGGFFSIKKPNGWDIITAGQCTLFGFYMRDRRSDLNQVFYFGSVGPIYMSQQQKNIDLNYMRMGGYRVQWSEMPVISPFTPINFIRQWHTIVSTSIARQYMQPLPQLRNLRVISVQPAYSGIGGGASTSLIRAVFEKNGRVGEGLFLVTTAPFMAFHGGPGGGTGYGLQITGITAEKKDFRRLRPLLIQAVQSFNMSRQYISQCMQTQRQTYAGIMKAGQTLREASDIIVKGWEARTKTYDILSEKYSDAILGYERLYDPDTGDVYTFNNGFYDKYRLNPNQYNKPNLKPLPNNSYKLWSAPAMDGYRHVTFSD